MCIREGETKYHEACNNAMLFIMEGRVECAVRGAVACEARWGQILFIPIRSCYQFHALRNTEILIIRLFQPMRLCESFRIESLYDEKRQDTEEKYALQLKRGFSTLEIHPSLWDFLKNLRRSVADGLKCKRYFELAVEQFFILLRCYYHREELYDFLYMVLSKNVVFSEYIRLRWMNFKTVKDMADSMCLAPKYFTRKFKTILGENPHRWMEKNRARHIYKELTLTDKALKQIAAENGFESMSQFTQFVKRALGHTPIEIKRKIMQ
jgi:AraC-like DNA-binding protein